MLSFHWSKYLFMGLAMLIGQVVPLQERAPWVIMSSLEQISSLDIQRTTKNCSLKHRGRVLLFNFFYYRLGLLISYKILVCPSLNHHNYFVIMLLLFTCPLILCFMFILNILSLIIILYKRR